MLTLRLSRKVRPPLRSGPSPYRRCPSQCGEHPHCLSNPERGPACDNGERKEAACRPRREGSVRAKARTSSLPVVGIALRACCALRLARNAG
jgi:hypothetical protein